MYLQSVLIKYQELFLSIQRGYRRHVNKGEWGSGGGGLPEILVSRLTARGFLQVNTTALSINEDITPRGTSFCSGTKCISDETDFLFLTTSTTDAVRINNTAFYLVK